MIYVFLPVAVLYSQLHLLHYIGRWLPKDFVLLELAGPSSPFRSCRLVSDTCFSIIIFDNCIKVFIVIFIIGTCQSARTMESVGVLLRPSHHSLPPPAPTGWDLWHESQRPKHHHPLSLNCCRQTFIRSTDKIIMEIRCFDNSSAKISWWFKSKPIWESVVIRFRTIWIRTWALECSISSIRRDHLFSSWLLVAHCVTNFFNLNAFISAPFVPYLYYRSSSILPKYHQNIIEENFQLIIIRIRSLQTFHYYYYYY